MSVLGGIVPCGSGDRPRACHLWYILVTLCRFDSKEASGQKQDHLFLPREGWAIWKSQEFKVVTSGPHFDIGSMAGLMDLFG